jgi:hypothetical protein
VNFRFAVLALALGAVLFVPSPASAAEDFHALVDQYFNAALPYQPSYATALGIHTYDTKLENYSRSTIDAEIRGLHYFLKKFEAVSAAGLDQGTQGDLSMMQNNLRSQLLSLETIRMWEKNPDNYSSGIAASAFVLMERKFAPANDRLRSLVSREKQMPAVFTAARENLKNPPHIYTEIAIEQLPGLVSFFQSDVPAAFTDATDPALKAEFAKTNAAVIAALGEYGKWLQSDLLPRSNGDFRFGADTFSKKLLYDEMVDTPLDKLLEIAYADLHKNQAEFARVAKEVDPAKDPKEVLAGQKRSSRFRPTCSRCWRRRRRSCAPLRRLRWTRPARSRPTRRPRTST